MSDISLNKGITAMGVMSGTSLDGLDLAYCNFKYLNDKWWFDIRHCKTIEYSLEWQNRLRDSNNISGENLTQLSVSFGRFTAEMINQFILDNGLVAPDLIASHGHTVFHQPDNGVTLQIGSGSDIAAITGILTVSDFRTQDVALGGQGAPLVPVGDKLLFSQFDACLNLGGFSNISFDTKGVRSAFDICPVNIVLNKYSRMLGFAFDEGGKLASGGTVNETLLGKLNNLAYYYEESPKSLGAEWVEHIFIPLLEVEKLQPRDILRTLVEHMAMQMGKTINQTGVKNVLVTGGGVYNVFLIGRLKEYSRAEIVIPGHEVIDYKEALIFAFLGVLRVLGIPNVLASVTGAKSDHTAGVINPVF